MLLLELKQSVYLQVTLKSQISDHKPLFQLHNRGGFSDLISLL